MISLLTLMFVSGPAEEPFRFSGVARTEDGRVFYREEHEVFRKGPLARSATTRYFNPEGKLIASIHSDFSKDPFAPSYRMVGPDGEVLEGASVRGERLVIQSGERSKIKVLSRRNARIVTGQGLDHYTRYHLNVLQGGGKLTVTFPIPSRLDTYTFEVFAVESPRKDQVRVRIEMDNWFLALLAPHLEADYDLKTGRLLQYRGVSNLTDGNGDNPRVRIDYEYGGGDGS